MCIWGEGFQYEAEKEAVLCCIASENPSVSRFSFRDFDICYMIYTVKPTSVHWWPNGDISKLQFSSSRSFCQRGEYEFTFLFSCTGTSVKKQ